MRDDFWWWIDNTEREFKILKEQIRILEDYAWLENVDREGLIASFPVETALMGGKIENFAIGQFEQNLRKICFSLGYAIFENQMLYLCEKLYKMGKTSINIYGYRGRRFPGASDAKEYLVQELGVDFDSLAELWKLIDIYKDIRNLILHYNGFVRSGDRREKTIKSFISMNGSLSFDDNITIIGIQRGFCKVALDTLVDFCEGLYNEIQNFTK